MRGRSDTWSVTYARDGFGVPRTILRYQMPILTLKSGWCGDFRRRTISSSPPRTRGIDITSLLGAVSSGTPLLNEGRNTPRRRGSECRCLCGREPDFRAAALRGSRSLGCLSGSEVGEFVVVTHILFSIFRVGPWFKEFLARFISSARALWWFHPLRAGCPYSAVLTGQAGCPRPPIISANGELSGLAGPFVTTANVRAAQI
jgi:hypothetical protein